MDTSLTNSSEEIRDARRDRTDWAAVSGSARLEALEVEGYVVLPGIICEDLIETLRAETSKLPTRAVDYSEHQRGCPDVQWTDSPQSVRLAALSAMVTFLTEVLGDDLICTSLAYAVSHPGHPGIALHTDAQPYGSKIFGTQASSPCLVRVLYYLDDLTPERSPFKVVPRSHLSLHSDANPYQRYLSHDEEVMVTCPAGSAIVINQRVFHGNYPNFSATPRRLLAIGYRPAWAGPISEVPEHDAQRVARLPANVRPLFRSPNTSRIDFGLPNRPDNMKRGAPGISPSRWQLPTRAPRLDGD